MAHLIDKDALVSEIERLKEEFESQDYAAYTEAYIIGVKHTLETISDILDTLEAKEVDLEKEMIKYFETMKVQEYENIFESTFNMIAKHFFELGIKAQEGE